MKIAILGYGVEGKSALRFLKKKYPRAEIEIRDKKSSPDYLKCLDAFDMIVRSPGIPYLNPEIQQAKQQGIKITSATKLFFSELGSPTSKLWLGGLPLIIGITGTKGKGTTAAMLYCILKHAGKDVSLVGNIGAPMLDILQKFSKKSIAIAELSSFQLQDLDVSPHIAILLDIAPDHLDYHASMKEYVAAKTTIAFYQKRNDFCIYVKNNSFARKIADKSKGKKISVDVIRAGKEWIDEMMVPGEHNLYNATIAAAVARLLGINDKIIRSGLRHFHGLPHHLELVRKYNGVTYYNDSASTNPISTVAALSAIKGPKILIAGGVDKNFDYHILKNVVKNTNTRMVILYGANRFKIARAIGKASLVLIVKNLPEALKRTQNIAIKGESVIFSPASASFDMFENSKERGQIFNRLVRSLF